jgi:uncharacterized membrane protein YqaE (UPF0057 family)
MENKDISLLALLLAIFIPPVGVLIKEGLGVQFLINLILTFLGYIPGIVHALYIILREKQ